MPSAIVTANTTPQTVFTCPTTRIIKLKRIDIDHHGANAVELTIQDVFTPSVSNGTAVPVATTENRLIVSAAPGTHQSFVDGMDGLRFLGVCQIDSTVIDANCDITVTW